MTQYIAALTLALAVLTSAGCGLRQRPPRQGPPGGFVDLPKAGAVLRPGPTLVGGWAVDETGIREVRVYFDDDLKARTRLEVARPDVSRAMPGYAKAGDIHGWNLLVDFGMAPGNHTIRVEALARDGTVGSIGVVPVTVLY